jgi:hypothetical protein
MKHNKVLLHLKDTKLILNLDDLKVEKASSEEVKHSCLINPKELSSLSYDQFLSIEQRYCNIESLDESVEFIFEDSQSTFDILKQIITKENSYIDKCQLKVLYAFAILFC